MNESTIATGGAICSFDGCTKKHRRNGLCDGHSQQARKGQPLSCLKRRRPTGSLPVIEYAEVSCDVSGLEGNCHVFAGAKTEAGYGEVSVNGKVTLVHRYVWEEQIGTIPDKMVIDHRCRNRACCNIKHLRVVTNYVNLTENVVGAAWQINAEKTHCKYGHLLGGDNMRIGIKKGRQTRVCLACAKVRREKWKSKHGKLEEPS